MKVAIATEGGAVSAHFGRCPAYTILEIEDGKITDRSEIANPGHQPGFLPRFLAEKGVKCIVAGGMGPRAQGLFAQQGIETVLGVQGRIDDVIEEYRAGRLSAGEDLCNHQPGDRHDCGEEHHAHPISAKPGSRICITAAGRDLEAEIDPSFGRAPYFLLLDPIARSMEVLANPHADMDQGAGIQAARYLSDKQVSILMTGQVGPNAARVLKASGIQIITGTSGKVRDVIQNLAKEVK